MPYGRINNVMKSLVHAIAILGALSILGGAFAQHKKPTFGQKVSKAVRTSEKKVGAAGRKTEEKLGAAGNKSGEKLNAAAGKTSEKVGTYSKKESKGLNNGVHRRTTRHRKRRTRHHRKVTS